MRNIIALPQSITIIKFFIVYDDISDETLNYETPDEWK